MSSRRTSTGTLSPTRCTNTRSTGSASVMKHRCRRRDVATQPFELGIQRQPAQRAGHVLFLGEVGDRRLGAGAVEQRRIARRPGGSSSTCRGRVRSRSRAIRRRARRRRLRSCAAATGRCRRSGCCSARRAGPHCALRACARTGRTRCRASSAFAASRTLGVAVGVSRTWFMCCVVASRLKNSTARAGQPVTSRASCSSTTAVPLRRR